MKIVRVLIAALALTIVAAPRPTTAATALSQLRGIAELKGWFNGLKGHPRLILLLSPT